MDCPPLQKIVNSVPAHCTYTSNKAPTLLSDSLLLKAVLEGWPRRTWLSPKQRVHFQAQRLHDVLNRVGEGALQVVRSSGDVDKVHSDEGGASASGAVGALLAVEGMSCAEGRIQSVREFYDDGIRIL